MNKYRPRSSWLRLAYETAIIDPFDLYPNATHEPLHPNLQLALRNDRIRQTGLLGFGWRAGRLLTRLASWPFRNANRLPSGLLGHCWIAQTRNQVVAASPVHQALLKRGDDSVLVGSGELDLLILRSPWKAVWFLPLLFLRWFRADGYRRRSFGWSFDDLALIYGIYWNARRWLERNPLRSLIVLNDHSLLPSVLVKAAQDSAVPTAYLQHACVTDRFPPLKVDLALLDGQDSAEKYDVVDRHRTKVCKIGIPRFDAYVESINEGSVLRRLGVCFSLADEVDRIDELLDALSPLRDLDILVRPHMGMPAQVIRHIERVSQSNGFEMSRHAEEKAFEFLKRIDVLISGTSAIALEATLLNVTPINFVLCRSEPDWYGFIRNGLVDSTDDPDELVRWLKRLQQHRPEVQRKAKYFCETVQTDHHGKSAELAASTIAESLTDLGPENDRTETPTTDSKSIHSRPASVV